VHRVEEYWNDIGSLAELRQGTFDALAGALRIEVAGEQLAPGVTVAEGSVLEALPDIEGSSGSAATSRSGRACA